MLECYSPICIAACGDMTYLFKNHRDPLGLKIRIKDAVKFRAITGFELLGEP